MPTDSEAIAFRYPAQPLARRHGPCGYADYQSFRPWLRDEFSFRCVYCLIREQWGRVTGEFDLDHACLNSPAMTRWRRTWLRIIELAEAGDLELFRELMGYPRDLPNLASCRVPENIRPEGIDDCYFARRERGELPPAYLE